MDRKSFIIFGVSFVLLLAWGPIVNNVLYPVDERRKLDGTNEVAQATNSIPVETTSPTAGEADQSPAVEVTPSETAVPLEVVSPARTFETEVIDHHTDLAHYRISNIRGGIELVDLKKFPNDTGCNRGSDQEAPVSEFAQLNPWSAAPILGLRLGESGWIEGYSLKEDGDTVTLSTDLENGLRIEKELTFGTNYVIKAKTRIINSGPDPVRVPQQRWAVGTATPIAPEDNGFLMGLMYYSDGDLERIKESWFDNRTLGCFPGRPRPLFEHNTSPVSWAAVDNQFFTIAVIPGEAAAGVAATRGDLLWDEETKARYTVKRGVRSELQFAEQVLESGSAIEREFDVFAGPKEYNTLARLSSSFGNELDSVMDFDGFFGFFAKALLLSMNGLNGFGLSYGFSIVVITFIIKLLFWPLTQASTRSMKRMAALQPQMKEIQEKYKEDPQKMNRKLMEFMRENRVSPLGGCLPILLQLPVFFGFYTMLQSAIELRGASFLWTCDLSKPDTLFLIPGLGIPFNLWPILMGAAQLWQTSMTPASPGMDPAQQKIMKYMPLMFVFILYNFSAGLALYWTVQNLLSIVQMKLTKNEPIDVKSPVASPLGKKKSKGRKKGRPGL